jgi:hypothetical protein
LIRSASSAVELTPPISWTSTDMSIFAADLHVEILEMFARQLLTHILAE